MLKSISLPSAVRTLPTVEVINLDTDIASLSDQTFYFDIDADGELDEISQLGAGSGYLALDKNVHIGEHPHIGDVPREQILLPLLAQAARTACILAAGRGIPGPSIST